jgi:hypothetical protein
MAQTTIDATDEIKRAKPCPNLLVHIATIAKMNVTAKKMNPNPKIQKVRNPRQRHIQPALTADDFAGVGVATWSVVGSGWDDGFIGRISASSAYHE